jgi:hypothetical protein
MLLGTISIDTIFHLMVWINFAAFSFGIFLIFKIWQSETRTKHGDSSTSMFLVYPPIYKAVLWVLTAAYFGSFLLLVVPGPYPDLPAWMFHANYYNEHPTLESSVLYYLYWLLFELVATGFPMLFLHEGPSHDAIVAAGKYALLWGFLAGGVKVRAAPALTCCALSTTVSRVAAPRRASPAPPSMCHVRRCGHHRRDAAWIPHACSCAAPTARRSSPLRTVRCCFVDGCGRCRQRDAHACCCCCYCRPLCARDARCVREGTLRLPPSCPRTLPVERRALDAPAALLCLMLVCRRWASTTPASRA